MILCDTGPLVALIDGRDAHHTSCVAVASALKPAGMLTTHACLAEAMYLVRRVGGWRAQEELWGYISDGLLRVHVPRAAELERMLELMRKYSDTPMDFADASLVAAAETLDERRVFTTDRHFYVYRQKQGQAFKVVS
jgi:predicted nucleic acid-binding protein